MDCSQGSAHRVWGANVQTSAGAAINVDGYRLRGSGRASHIECGSGSGGRDRVLGHIAASGSDDGAHAVALDPSYDDQLHADHYRSGLASASYGNGVNAS